MALSPKTASLLALLGKSPKAPVCMLDIPRVGGATYYSLRRVEDYLRQGRGVLRLTCNADGSLKAGLRLGRTGADFNLAGVQDLSAPAMPAFHTLLVNELAAWTLPEALRREYAPVGEGRPRWIPALTGLLLRLARERGWRLEYVLHDYFPVCPNFVLLHDREQRRYCGVPGMDDCSRCLRQDFMAAAFGPGFSLPAWRKAWADFLGAAARVTCPSQSARDILLRAYPDTAMRLAVIPHQSLLPQQPLRLPGPDKPLHIAVVGSLTVPKGALIVRELALLLGERLPKARLSLVGPLAAPGLSLPDNVTVTGPYAKEALSPLLRDLGASVGLIASVWPETFNYVTQELMQIGLPLVCFDLGAPAERIKTWEHGLLAREVSAEAALEALLRLDSRRVKPSASTPTPRE